METMQIALKKKKKKGKTRNKIKTTARLNEILNGSSNSPCRSLAIFSPSKRRQRIRKLAESVLRPFEEQVQQQVFLCSSPTEPSGSNQYKNNRLEQTIDLLDEDSQPSCHFVEDCDKSVDVLPTSTGRITNSVIDLSKDIPQQNEIIDLTETSINSPIFKIQRENISPTVIDISEEETNEKYVTPGTSDDIFVLGTYSNYSKSVLKKREVLKDSPSFIPLCNSVNEQKLSEITKKLKKKYLKKRLSHDKHGKRKKELKKRKSLRNAKKLLPKEHLAKVGGNVYMNSPVALPSSGLRPIIIDGSNVAFVHSEFRFACKRLEICINYFKERGHKVTAFVPQFRMSSHRNDDPQLLMKLVKQDDVVLTPSKRIDGKNIVPYDDRYIVQTAVLKGGIIISRDNYNDLLKENPAWAETIKYRTLAFTWVDDMLMFPKDPLGEFGPTLEEFLRFN